MAQRAIRQRRKKDKGAKKRTLLICVISLAVILLGFVTSYCIMRGAVNKVPANVVWNNIYVEETLLSGKTQEEAQKILEEMADNYKELEIKLVVEEVEKKVKLDDLGLKIKNQEELLKEAISYGKKGSVLQRYKKLKGLEEKALVLEPKFSVEEKVIKDVISKSFSELEGAAVDATIKRVDGQFVITEGKSGIKVDVKASVKVIEDYIAGDWNDTGIKTLKLVTTVDEPDVTKEQLSQVKDLLGTFSTNFNNRNNRGNNIRLATSRINGKVLLPGEELSASDSMGKRSAENGYLEAGTYLNGEVVQGYGGGVCQVSSTLYNAVILADLEIIERHPHSMLVDYVNPSMDAAISDGLKDLKFKNNTDAPVYIEGYIVGGKLTFSVYGKKANPNRTVSYVHEVLSTNDPGYKFVASGDPIGTLKKSVSVHVGTKAQLWKVVTENGVEVSRTVANKSNYAASPGTYIVGTATDNAEAKSIVTNAISSKNLNTIKEAIAQAKAVIAASQTPAAPQEPSTPSTPNEGDSTGTTP